MAIHEGNHPPNIEGTYFVSPYSLVKGYGRHDDRYPGYEFADCIYSFFAQSSGNQKISIAREGNSDNHYPSGEVTMTYVSGNHNTFSIFSALEGNVLGVNYKGIQVISGEITPYGIKNWESSFTLISKSADEKDILMPLNATRIFKDGDGISEKYNNKFKVGTERENTSLAVPVLLPDINPMK